MTAGSVSHFEKIAGLDIQGRRQPLQEVEFDTAGPVVLQVGDGRHSDPHGMGQRFLRQAALDTEVPDAEEEGAHGANYTKGADIDHTPRRKYRREG